MTRSAPLSAYGRSARLATVVVMAASLVACADLPSSGPTAREIIKDVEGPSNVMGYRIVNLDPTVLENLARAAPPGDSALQRFPASQPVDRLGPGDVLQITIFEVGSAMFAPPNSPNASASAAPAAAGENLPPVMVGQDGRVDLPYVGRIEATGQTVADLEALIVSGLKGRSQAPQVIVTVHDNVSNTIVVMGDVKKPGRLPLSLSGDRLLDAVAAAQGASYPTEDMIVRFTRGGASAESRLDQLQVASAANLVLQPQDRIELLHRPRSFTVFGATGKVSQAPFPTDRLSLAEAVATTGGPADQSADASAVFVFRYEPSLAAADAPDQPVIYRVNLSKPSGFFLAQRFFMRDHDLIYVANSRANTPTKLFQIVNLVFSPFYTAKIISQ
jgi:polysaccharide export outer membrane protein